MQKKEKLISPPPPAKLHIIYLICLLISASFFFLFGYNSPLFTFNHYPDYQWFMTMGNGLVHGKIPYRDLFEQKGPIVYFVTAFCCLFPKPGIVMLFIEIISMSLFLFFTYRICQKYLNRILSLFAILILIISIFTGLPCLHSGSTIEEFSLPIYTYFLLCWLEFMDEKRQWRWRHCFSLGVCFGILLWSKFTLLYFMIIPMIIWFSISFRLHQLKTVLIDFLFMLIGFTLITTPVLIFYAAHNAIDNLLYVYFFINITAYTNSPLETLYMPKLFLELGTALLLFIIWGMMRFALQKNKTGTTIALLLAFVVHFCFITFSCTWCTPYHYAQLIPYSIFGIINFINILKSTIPYFKKLTITAITLFCIILILPLFSLCSGWNRNKNEYSALVIAEIINHYELNTQTKATLFCYKTIDIGAYNSTNIIPNNYFFVLNNFSTQRFPEMYQAIQNNIKNQTSDFVITSLNIWNSEQDLLSQYYQPYIGEISDTYIFSYPDYQKIVLLLRKGLIS